jgi:hypothetical protein
MVDTSSLPIRTTLPDAATQERLSIRPMTDRAMYVYNAK